MIDAGLMRESLLRTESRFLFSLRLTPSVHNTGRDALWCTKRDMFYILSSGGVGGLWQVTDQGIGQVS